MTGNTSVDQAMSAHDITRLPLHQEKPDGSVSTTTLGPGQYAINDPGVWHTADVAGVASALFITAGLGTEHRPR